MRSATNSSHVVQKCSINKQSINQCRNCGGGDRGRVAIYRPFGELRRAKIVLSPVWCSRPTTGVPLAHATMNFVGLDLTASDRWHQTTTTTTYILAGIPVLRMDPVLSNILEEWISKNIPAKLVWWLGEGGASSGVVHVT
ncbi:hypothetical protein TNCV_2663281 [Trichonephila clavipes]|nr:hypothetical protein TNCV_2663281 [Trichonephila clavipes]